MSTQEFRPGDTVRGDDYARLPIGAKTVWKHCADSDGLPAEKVNFNAWREGTGLSAPIRTDAEMSLPRTITYLPEHAETEDATDAYVEPEPLKEGAEHSVERALKAADEFAAAMQKWGEVVREAAEKFGAGLLHALTTEAVEEPVALGAAVEAEHRESDGPDRLIRIGTPADDLAYPWYSPMYYGRYGWDELTNPKVIAPGWTEVSS